MNPNGRVFDVQQGGADLPNVSGLPDLIRSVFPWAPTLLRDIGPAAILVSPFVYTVQHLGSAPLEVVLSATADVLFGAADYYSDSLLPSLGSHSTGAVLLALPSLRVPVLSPDRIASWFGWLPLPL